jgi:hypothetical protein
MMTNDRRASYADDPIEEIDERAARHAQLALQALGAEDRLAAIVHAVLALQARVEEASYFIARIS